MTRFTDQKTRVPTTGGGKGVRNGARGPTMLYMSF